MKNSVSSLLSPAIGKRVCRIRVGAYRSLTLGVGKRIFHHDPKRTDAYKGEWEFIAYYSAWRIIRNGRIIAGKGDAEDDYSAFTKKLRSIRFGTLASISQPSSIDLRLTFSSGITLDMFGTTSDDAAFVDIFLPGNRALCLQPKGKWTIEDSSLPSNPKPVA